MFKKISQIESREWTRVHFGVILSKGHRVYVHVYKVLQGIWQSFGSIHTAVNKVSPPGKNKVLHECRLANPTLFLDYFHIKIVLLIVSSIWHCYL